MSKLHFAEEMRRIDNCNGEINSRCYFQIPDLILIRKSVTDQRKTYHSMPVRPEKGFLLQ